MTGALSAKWVISWENSTDSSILPALTDGLSRSEYVVSILLWEFVLLLLLLASEIL